MKHRTFAAFVLLVALVIPATSAAADSTDTSARAANRCVLQITGQRADGEFITDGLTCFTTLGAALSSLGVDVDAASDPSVPEAIGAGLFSTLSTIGIHYDGLNKTGASITVSGGACTGGWLNLAAAWVDRISSTANGCPTIRHFDGYGLTGVSQDTTFSTHNLTTLNNLPNSIQYM